MDTSVTQLRELKTDVRQQYWSDMKAEGVTPEEKAELKKAMNETIASIDNQIEILNGPQLVQSGAKIGNTMDAALQNLTKAAESGDLGALTAASSQLTLAQMAYNAFDKAKDDLGKSADKQFQ